MVIYTWSDSLRKRIEKKLLAKASKYELQCATLKDYVAACHEEDVHFGYGWRHELVKFIDWLIYESKEPKAKSLARLLMGQIASVWGDAEDVANAFRTSVEALTMWEPLRGSRSFIARDSIEKEEKKE